MCCRERIDEFFIRINDGRGNEFCLIWNLSWEWKILNGKIRVVMLGKKRKRCCSV